MSRIGKYVETESRLVLLQLGEGWKREGLLVGARNGENALELVGLTYNFMNIPLNSTF